jgi:hypothetical protein
MSYDKPSVVLAELWERQSAKGNPYFAGFWGGLSVALLRDGERPHPTRPDETVTVWRLVAQERQPRDGPQKAPQRRQEREQAPAGTSAPPDASARPGAPERPFRRQSATARRERAAAEVLARAGELNDPVPFG